MFTFAFINVGGFGFCHAKLLWQVCEFSEAVLEGGSIGVGDEALFSSGWRRISVSKCVELLFQRHGYEVANRRVTDFGEIDRLCSLWSSERALAVGEEERSSLAEGDQCYVPLRAMFDCSTME